MSRTTQNHPVVVTRRPTCQRARLAAALVAGLGALTASAAVCPVPSASHATLQAAVDDPACTEITLTGQVYPGSVVIGRSLTVTGVASAATTIQGQVRVTAGDVVLEALCVDTSSPALAGRFAAALEVAGGASAGGADLVVRHRAMLFGDGFESGTTGGWSATAP